MVCDLWTRLPGARNIARLVSFLAFAWNGSSGMLSFLVWGFAEDAVLKNVMVLPSTGDLRISTSSDSVISASIEACTSKVTTHAFLFTIGWIAYHQTLLHKQKRKDSHQHNEQKNTYKHSYMTMLCVIPFWQGSESLRHQDALASI